MKAIEIADYIIGKYQEEKIYIIPFRVNALLFFIQKEYVKKYNRLAFKESIEAVSYGVYIKEVRDKYSFIGSSRILIDVDKTILSKDIQEVTDYVMECAKNISTSVISNKIIESKEWKNTINSLYKTINISLNKEI